MKQLKTYEFGAGRSDGYDYAKLLDGHIWQLTEGQDFKCKATTFATLLRTQAKKAGKAVRIAKTEGGLVIQAVAKVEG